MRKRFERIEDLAQIAVYGSATIIGALLANILILPLLGFADVVERLFRPRVP